jgi:hypothetical protein
MRGTDEVQLKKKTEKKTKKTPQIICMGKQVTCKFERNEQFLLSKSQDQSCLNLTRTELQ